MLSHAGISWSLFWQLFSHDSQSVIQNSGPGLYVIHMLYLCKHSRTHWSHFYCVAASVVNTATKGLWTLIMYAKQLWRNFSNLCSIPSASLSRLLYLDSALGRLFLAKAMEHNSILSVILSHGQVIHSPHNCNSPAPSPTPDASVPTYHGFFTVELNACTYLDDSSVFVVPQCIFSVMSILSLQMWVFFVGYTPPWSQMNICKGSSLYLKNDC